MSYPNTTNLALQVPDRASAAKNNFLDQVTLDQQLSASLSILDAAVGAAGLGGVTILRLEGATSTQGAAGVIGSAFNDGANRSISRVVAWAQQSGSGGVSRVDVQFGLTTFASIFSNNAFKPAVSSSLGDFGQVSKTAFVSGSAQVWPAGTTLKAILDTVAGDATTGAQKGLVVQVIWKMA